MTEPRRQARVALFALLGVGLAVLVLVGFGARAWLRRTHYAIAFPDTVYGLERGGDVYYEGVHVGTVTAMELAPTDVGGVEVSIEVDRDTPILATTRAYLLYAGVTGVKEIDLRTGPGPSPRLAAGATIPVGESELDRLERSADHVVARSGDVLDRLDQTASNLAELTGRPELGEILERGRAAVDDLAGASRGLRALVSESRAPLHRTLAAVDRAAGEAADLLGDKASAVVARANDLTIRLDQMVRESAGPFHAAVTELHEASRSLAALLRELRESPSLLLLSRPPAARRER